MPERYNILYHCYSPCISCFVLIPLNFLFFFVGYAFRCGDDGSGYCPLFFIIANRTQKTHIRINIRYDCFKGQGKKGQQKGKEPTFKPVKSPLIHIRAKLFKI